MLDHVELISRGEAGKLREAAAAVTGTQSWCAQLRQWQGRRW